MLQRTPLLVNRLDTVYAWSALLWRMVERIAALHVARVIRALCLLRFEKQGVLIFGFGIVRGDREK
jgi:hypothetical protein